MLRKEQYQIVNSSGSIVKEGFINLNEPIDLHNLGNGLYIIILIDDGIKLKASIFIKI